MARQCKGYVRQRKDGKWEAQYTYQKQRYSIYGNFEYEVQQKLDATLLSIRQGSYIKPSRHTVASWMAEWYKTYALNSLRPSSFINYDGIIKRHINPAIGKVQLHNVSVDMLQRFFNEKQQGGRCDGKKGGLRVKTLKNIKRVLNGAFSQAYFNRLIPFNPVEGVKLPTDNKPEQRVLADSDKDILLELSTESNDPTAKAIIILLNCGLRKGELLGLRWENVHLDKGFFHVQNTLARLHKFEVNSNTQNYIRIDTYADTKNKTGIYLGPVKTQKANRRVYLPNSVKKALVDLKGIQDEYKRGYKGDNFNPYGFVLCNEMGNVVDPKKLEDDFRKWIDYAKIKKVNLHATRHTFATEALSKTTDIITVSEILGHAMPSTTLDMYGHTFDHRKRALMASFK